MSNLTLIQALFVRFILRSIDQCIISWLRGHREIIDLLNHVLVFHNKNSSMHLRQLTCFESKGLTIFKHNFFYNHVLIASCLVLSWHLVLSNCILYLALIALLLSFVCLLTGATYFDRFVFAVCIFCLASVNSSDGASWLSKLAQAHATDSVCLLWWISDYLV